MAITKTKKVSRALFSLRQMLGIIIRKIMIRHKVRCESQNPKLGSVMV